MNLFNEPEVKPAELPKTNLIAAKGHLKLITIHGTVEGKKCKTCQFIHQKSAGSKTFYKCEKLKSSNSPATDHRLKWAACGLYKESKP